MYALGCVGLHWLQHYVLLYYRLQVTASVHVWYVTNIVHYIIGKCRTDISVETVHTKEVVNGNR